jgi:putative ABC transport system permease protein
MTFLADLRRVFRSLVRERAFSTAVILTLALGIGANTAMFTLLRGTLLRPLPNREGERLIYLRQSAEGAGQDNVLFSVPEIVDIRGGVGSLSGIAEYSTMTFTMLADEEPKYVQAGVISGNYFDVMGLGSVIGRVTTPADDGPSAAGVGVLSHHFWLQHFGGDPGVIGKLIRVNDRPLTIVGVAQSAPHYPQRTDIFVNMVTSPHHLDATMVHGRTHRMTEVFARLEPTASLDQVRSELAKVTATIHADHPDAYEKASGFAISVAPLRDALNERAKLTMWLLMGAAAFVLLIACANVANLTLMRGVRREREMLVRSALGAGMWRLRQLLLAENLTLALIGGFIGVLVAYAGLEMLVAFARQISPRADEVRVDSLVLGVTLLTSVAAAVVLSFAPRLGGERALAVAGRRATAGKGGQRLQQALVVAQLAVCVVLLSAAGLLVRTLTKLQSVETGISAPERVLSMEVPIEGQTIAEPEKLAMYERMRDRIATLPGVTMVGLGSTVPLRNTPFVLEVKAEGRAVVPGEATPRAVYKTADPTYFEASGIALLRGRNFASTDRQGTARVVVINESLAKRLFPDQDPIGRRIAWTGEVLKFIPVSGDWRTIVGIVGDTRDAGLDSEPTPTMFQPFAQEVLFAGALIIRTNGLPATFEAPVRRTIRDMYPRQLIENVATLDQVRDATVAPRRLNALLITSFGALAMIIAVVGIAGVLAFSVSSRTNEIGIRMSLGADAARVRRMVLSEGGVLLGAGLTLGVIGALLAARLLQGLLFGVQPHDPVTLGVVTIVLAAVGLAGCWLPATRAARVDPGVALRAE